VRQCVAGGQLGHNGLIHWADVGLVTVAPARYLAAAGISETSYLPRVLPGGSYAKSCAPMFAARVESKTYAAFGTIFKGTERG
jgi:hypothetical protein